MEETVQQVQAEAEQYHFQAMQNLAEAVALVQSTATTLALMRKVEVLSLEQAVEAVEMILAQATQAVVRVTQAADGVVIR